MTGEISKESCQANLGFHNKINWRELKGDLAKSIQGLDEFLLPLASLGPSTAVQHKEQIPPWTERHSTLLWIILILKRWGLR